MRINLYFGLSVRLLAHKIYNFGYVLMFLKLKVIVCYYLMLHSATSDNPVLNFCIKDSHASCYSIFEVTECHVNGSPSNLYQSVEDRNQISEICNVLLMDSLKCKVPEFLTEDWPRPPLRY